MLAVGAWVIWEVATILISRIKAAAEKHGWFGVKQEIFGGGAAQVTTATTVPEIIKPPSGVVPKPTSKAGGAL